MVKLGDGWYCYITDSKKHERHTVLTLHGAPGDHIEWAGLEAEMGGCCRMFASVGHATTSADCTFAAMSTNPASDAAQTGTSAVDGTGSASPKSSNLMLVSSSRANIPHEQCPSRMGRNNGGGEDAAVLSGRQYGGLLTFRLCRPLPPIDRRKQQRHGSARSILPFL